MEIDIKKIVALSTIRQIRFIALIFSLGIKPLSFLHLLTHALFKRIIFINIGNLIHQTYNNQQTKILATRRKTTIFLIQIRGLSLIGLAFTRGFTRKDNFLDKIENTNRTSLILLISFLISLTFFYTRRLLFPLSQNLPTKEKRNPSLSLFLLSLLFSTLIISKETPERFKILRLIFQCSFVFIIRRIILKLKLTNKIINNSFKILNKLHLNIDMPFKYFLEKTFFSNSSLLLMKIKQITFILRSLLIFSILFMR